MNIYTIFMREAQQTPSSLLRFAHKTSKNRRLGDFLPLKLRKQPINRGFCDTKWRKNLQVQQAARSLLRFAHKIV
jgi:hypothetical protein